MSLKVRRHRMQRLRMVRYLVKITRRAYAPVIAAFYGRGRTR